MDTLKKKWSTSDASGSKARTAILSTNRLCLTLFTQKKMIVAMMLLDLTSSPTICASKELARQMTSCLNSSISWISEVNRLHRSSKPTSPIKNYIASTGTRHSKIRLMI